MKNSRRVVITGLGVVAPNGIGKETFWQNLIAGKSAIFTGFLEGNRHESL
jgi:3-oxoacyl-(acyl-carrier-protein) synthase